MYTSRIKVEAENYPGNGISRFEVKHARHKDKDYDRMSERCVLYDSGQTPEACFGTGRQN